MAIGEVFLGAIIALLLQRLASSEFIRFLRVHGLDSQLRECSKKVAIIQGVLSNAESRYESDKGIKMWFDELQDIALDLDDIVDELSTDALRLDLSDAAGEASNSSSRKVCKFNIASCSTSAFRTYAKNRKMDSKIEQIYSRLDELVEQITLYRLLVENTGGNVGPSGNEERYPAPTTSLVNEHEVIGRDDDKEKIIDLLLQNNGSTFIIAIVGIGGIGKTTLAQLIFNDQRRVENCFHRSKVWISVRGCLDVVDITKMILREITDEKDLDSQNFDFLQRKLRDTASKKNFLLVLDDVWEEDDDKWESLFKPLVCSGGHRSKVIVTTQENKVPRIMHSGQPYYPYCLMKLKDEDGLSLLAQFAFGIPNFDEHPHLKDIGQQLVKKCDSLTLAIKHIWATLHNKPTHEWQKLLNSEIWTREKVLPSLKLSYDRLSPHLKQCFAYCSIFPKGYEFDTRELVLLWMAKGFLEQGNETNDMEELGEYWFKQLVSRSFFEISKSSSSMYVMHDLIHDLTQHVAQKTCFVLKDELDNDFENRISFARHSSYATSDYDLSSKFEVFQKAMRIRIFLQVRRPNLMINDYFYLSKKVLVVLLPKLECLRVLSLHGYEIKDLPDSIGKLKHLRFLDLSETKLKVLPESMTSLCNLQTLSLDGCKYFKKLPSGMEKLVSLQHLKVSNTPKLDEIPLEIGERINLQTLSKIIIGKTGGFNLKKLGSLTFLRGKISIQRLRNVISSNDARDAKLEDKSYCEELRLSWGENVREIIQDENVELEVLDSLRPNPTNLKALEIIGYGGKEFPTWVRKPSCFSKLVDLLLDNAPNCESLPSLGQLSSLKKLVIKGMGKVRVVGNEFYGADGSSSNSNFPSLELLVFSNMGELREWNGFTDMTESQKPFCKLQELFLHNCPKLINV